MVSAWLISKEDQLASIGVTRALEPRSKPGLLEQVVQGSPFATEGTRSSFLGQLCAFVRGKHMCNVLGDTYYCREGGKRQHISALVIRAMWHKTKAYRKRNPCTALRVSGCPVSLLCSAFAPLQGSDAPLNPHCLLHISLGELVKVEAQDPYPSPAIPSPCTAQPVFPLRCYRALPALLRALPWEGAGKLSCLDRP